MSWNSCQEKHVHPIGAGIWKGPQPGSVAKHYMMDQCCSQEQGGRAPPLVLPGSTQRSRLELGNTVQMKGVDGPIELGLARLLALYSHLSSGSYHQSSSGSFAHV